MIVSIVLIVLAIILIILGVIIIKKGIEKLFLLSLLAFVLSLNFGVSGVLSLAHVNMLLNDVSITNQNILALANFGASFLYGLVLLAGVSMICGICAIIAQLGE